MEGLTTPDSAPLIDCEILKLYVLKASTGLSQWARHNCDLIRTASGTSNHFQQKLIKNLKVLG